jgi:alanyl-tRNA synthetase
LEIAGGGKVDQKGSLVDPKKTRFDFSHNTPLSDEELTRVQELCNAQIRANLAVYTKEVDQGKARDISTLRAVFGEKYPDRVRVVSIGIPIGEEGIDDPNTLLGNPKNPEWMKYSVEFCGGTHVKNTQEIEVFVLTHEEGVAKGVRRVVGISGETARAAISLGEQLLVEVGALAGGEPRPSGRADSPATGTPASTVTPRGLEPAARLDLSAAVAEFQRRVGEAVIPILTRRKIMNLLGELQRVAKEQDKQSAAASSGAVLDTVRGLFDHATTKNGVTVIVGEVPSASADALRAGVDWIRNKTSASAVLLATVDDGKVTLVAGMSKTVVDRGVKAGDLIKEVCPLVGGKGGGRPDMAQGGGSYPAGLAGALERASLWLRDTLS